MVASIWTVLAQISPCSQCYDKHHLQNGVYFADKLHADWQRSLGDGTTILSSVSKLSMIRDAIPEVANLEIIGHVVVLPTRLTQKGVVAGFGLI